MKKLQMLFSNSFKVGRPLNFCALFKGTEKKMFLHKKIPFLLPID